MSSTECIDMQQLDKALSSTRATQHAKDCARCFALLHEHTAFLAERDADGADIADAEARLETFLRALPAAADGRPTRRLRPWMWAGALAAAIAVVMFLPRDNSAPDPPLLRDGSAAALQLHPALARDGQASGPI